MTTPLQNASSGYKKEVYVLTFVSSLLTVNDLAESENDDDVIQRTGNKDYHLNKRINKRLEGLKDTITSHSNSVAVVGLSEWIKNRNKKLTIKALAMTNTDKYSLEYLAIWIMYVNFVERDKPLDESLQHFREIKYLDIADMMDKSDAEYMTGEMMMLAYDILKVLKS